MSVSVCWSAKGGSGTTVVAASLALLSSLDSTLVDLAGELPAVLGLPEPTGQGVTDWLSSDAPAPALADLTVTVDRATQLVPLGSGPLDRASPRWPELLAWLRGRANAIVDAGTGPPPDGLAGDGVRSILVTRACFLALRRAVAAPHRPDGVVLVAEPGRSLRASDVTRAVGAPVVATVSVDPAVARVVDAGLLLARLPRVLQRELRALTAASTPTSTTRGVRDLGVGRQAVVRT